MILPVMIGNGTMTTGFGNVMMSIPVIMDIPTMGENIILRNLICIRIRPTKAINQAVPLKAAALVLVRDLKEDLAVNVS